MECFWPRCSDHKRCKAHGSCVAKAQAGGAAWPDQFNFDVFERATEIMALWLARFRSEDAEVTANDRLTAGHLAGALAANDLLVTEMPSRRDQAASSSS